MSSVANMQKFRSNIGNGLIRPNQFRCFINLPNFVASRSAAQNRIEFSCRAASLPGSTVAPIPVYYQGRAFNVAGERQFQPWTVTIYNEDFNIRDALVQWSHAFNNINDNSGIIQPAIYQSDLFVQQLDRNGENKKVIQMVHAFPIDISPIELDWENNAQVEMFQCTFVYDWFHDEAVNMDASSRT